MPRCERLVVIAPSAPTGRNSGHDFGLAISERNGAGTPTDPPPEPPLLIRYAARSFETSSIRAEKPISLSYHAMTFTIRPPITIVQSASTMEER